MAAGCAPAARRAGGLAALPSCGAGPELLGCRNDKVAHAALQVRPVSHSLALVAPQGLEWIIKAGKDGKRSTRVAFTLDGAEYNLSLTDPVWEKRLKGLPLGTHPRRAARIADEDEIWLTISLGEPFAPAEDGEEFCYKIAAAVIAAPCPNKLASGVRPARTVREQSRSGFQAVPAFALPPTLSDYPDPFAEEEAAANTREGMEAEESLVVNHSAEAPVTAPDVFSVEAQSAPFSADLPAPSYSEQAAPSLPPAPLEEVAVISAAAQKKPPAAHPGSTAYTETRARRAALKRPGARKSPKCGRRFPRAYMPWSRDEDALLRRLLLDGETADNIAAQMQRHVGSVRVRMEKLGMAEGIGANSPSASRRRRGTDVVKRFRI